jgi:hypothetical protein
MNPEQLQYTYEAIQNPILRLLVYFLAAAVAGLVAGNVYQYRDRQILTRVLIDLSREATGNYSTIASGLEGLHEGQQEMKSQLLDRLLKS